MYQDNVLKDDSPQHKGISNMLSVIACVRQLLAAVTETSTKTLGLAGS